jgi:phosphoribosylanthranilate isomerase
MGFIFYTRSPRFVKNPDISIISSLPDEIKKVGVFVNENLENILTYIHKFDLDAVQLHGAENQKLCKAIKEEANTMVIKAFPIMDKYNLKVTKNYEDVADLFLFDTKTDLYGGSGQKFNWNILHEYHGEKDFFLSGGIGPDDVKAIRKLKHPKMIGVDLNSRFELKPGLKNVSMLREFIEELNKPTENEDENTNEQD